MAENSPSAVLVRRLAYYCLQPSQAPIRNKITNIATDMRPASQKSHSSAKRKKGFQTMFKSRVSGASHILNSSLLDSRPETAHARLQQQTFKRTATLLSENNFSHHDAQQCLCGQCNCGRHLCKMNVIRPDLTKNSIYQRSFYPKRTVPSLVTYAKEYDRFTGPNLELNSTYHEGFTGHKGDKVEHPHPDDLLHSEGPAPKLTSYSVQFPGHHGENQYVKPTDRHTRGSFPLRSKTTYSGQYVGKKQNKDDYKYIADQLKTGSNWYGQTTYSGYFQQPNPEYFAKPVKVLEKKEENPNYSRQYETTYRHEFLPKKTPVCPSKILLQTRAQGVFTNSKGNFAENSDFKSLSPNFQAISTSKHSYV